MRIKSKYIFSPLRNDKLDNKMPNKETITKSTMVPYVAIKLYVNIILRKVKHLIDYII